MQMPSIALRQPTSESSGGAVCWACCHARSLNGRKPVSVEQLAAIHKAVKQRELDRSRCTRPPSQSSDERDLAEPRAGLAGLKEGAIDAGISPASYRHQHRPTTAAPPPRCSATAGATAWQVYGAAGLAAAALLLASAEGPRGDAGLHLPGAEGPAFCRERLVPERREE